MVTELFAKEIRSLLSFAMIPLLQIVPFSSDLEKEPTSVLHGHANVAVVPSSRFKQEFPDSRADTDGQYSQIMKPSTRWFENGLK